MISKYDELSAKGTNTGFRLHSPFARVCNVKTFGSCLVCLNMQVLAKWHGG